MKSRLIQWLALLMVVSPASADQAGRIDLTKLDRSIAKEPHYGSAPHYALLVFGPEAAHRSWLVMDGDNLLFLDRNGNGDLTDPEDRIELDMAATKKIRVADGSGYSGFNVFEIGTIAGVKLRFNFWVRKRDFVPTDDWQRNIMRQREANSWENGTLLRIVADGMQVQNPTVMAATPADAQITHLDGLLTVGLRGGMRQKLQLWPQSTTFDIHIGTPALPPRGHADSMFAPLATSELPTDVHPQAVFTYRPKLPGGQPIIQTIALDKRCCGDSFYGQMTVPREAGEGLAKVSVTYSAQAAGRIIHPADFELPVGGQRSSLDSETSYVLFSDEQKSIGLDEALVALRVAGLTVQKIVRPENTSLQVQMDGRPLFAITLNRIPEVGGVAHALAENGRFVEVLKQCNSRFDIFRFPDRSDFRQNELSLIHKILLQETAGIVYIPWDKQLSRPE
jgi:hypothetical protein